MTMREKIARGMHTKARETMTRLPDFDDLPDISKLQALEMADAALDALMEPTEGMLEAEAREFGANTNCLQVMIRAAKDGK